MRVRGDMRFAALALALALVLAGCGEKAVQEPARAAPPSGPRMTLRTVDAQQWQDVSAEIATVDQAQALARIPGILTTLTVREGDLVRKGQAIGQIIDSQLGPQSSATAAQAAAAMAQAAQADAELKRVRYLFDKGVYARARLDQAQAAAQTARAQVRAAQAQQAAVGATAGQGVVLAPTSGRILRSDIPAGSPVAPGMSIVTVTAGATILRLELPESLAGKVHVGSAVRATIGDTRQTGRVIRLYPSITAGQIVADVAMPGLDNTLIGRRVPAQVESGTRPALIVPAAFVERRFGIETVAVLARDGAVSRVPVQTAPASDDRRVEILSGVGAGDTLIGNAAR
ncbi:efflux RND transporter periplasmic adaptor subunit [Sphingomonas sp.]|uniref:efflux RND transporter periplasmic adaptor subunit n=1 Tax=Sphingomonas sp. TaxID=28214 RepID=UPI001EB585E8|nr:efflux RND transporter periplasmic adaptor subunit [Sphingomonas sp.]MBX3593352.1 efflux RND transporter periplasmic adaptor subunit [Sphingomonas sp.]